MIFFAIPLFFFACTASAMMGEEEMHSIGYIMGSEIVSIYRFETDDLVTYEAPLTNDARVSGRFYTAGPLLGTIEVVHFAYTSLRTVTQKTLANHYYHLLKDLYEQLHGNAQ